MDSDVIAWNEIEQRLSVLRKVDGGFTAAQRGLVTLSDGREVFVKIGTDEQTKGWARREINAYWFLRRAGYSFIPRLLSTNADATGFAIEPLTPADGWDWSSKWTEARLSRTFEAMDALAALPVSGPDRAYFSEEIISENDDGWRQLLASVQRRAALVKRLRASGEDELAGSLDFEAMAKKSARFTFAGNKLVHNDLRADNCPWNPRRRQVKLVDWNQLQLGDRRIDLAATLVHVHKSGLNVLKRCRDRLDADALHWMAGFFFDRAARPVWSGGPERLRRMHLESAIVAYRLWQEIC